jgi:hypothetical protein
VKPANPGGVVFAVVLMAVFLPLGFSLGLGEVTRKGIPVALLALVVAVGSVYLLVHSWRTPRE